MPIPTFIDLQEVEQCDELRQYLKDLGAIIGTENATTGIIGDLEEIVSVLDVCLNDENEGDVESVLNSIVSLLIQVPQTGDARCPKLIAAFCDKLVKCTANKLVAVNLRVLQNLFEGLGDHKEFRYIVYHSLIVIAGKTNQMHIVPTDLDKIKTWFTGISIDKYQDLFRLLHDVLLQTKNSELASKVMIELLGTYTEENASQARSDAQKCIVSSLADPATFLLDNLLPLKPVKSLEGQPIHNLLNIFVADKLAAYIAFYKSNQAFVDSLGLQHEQNLKKMRLLTFMQLAESKKEISFDEVKTDLQLTDDEVEPFIIDVLKTKLVRAKIDQLNQKILVSSTMHRTFGRQQWQQLKDTLSLWQMNLTKVQLTISGALRTQTQLPQMTA